MPGFYDARCPKCHTKIGWRGELKDKPACPKCGYKDDPKALAEVQRKMDELRRQADEEH